MITTQLSARQNGGAVTWYNFFKKFLKRLLTFSKTYRILDNVLSETEQNGVWLSLARAPGLGPGCRRFESCHPDFSLQISIFYAGVVQW